MLIDRRLRSISPLWFARITKAKTLSGLLRKQDVKQDFKMYELSKTLDIQAYSGCMVAESYGFDDVYNEEKQRSSDLNCKKCTSISQRVVYPIKHHWQDSSKKYFQREIKEFCNHVERDHGVNLSHGF